MAKLYIEQADGYTEIWLRSDVMGQGVLLAVADTKDQALSEATDALDAFSREAQDAQGDDE